MLVGTSPEIGYSSAEDQQQIAESENNQEQVFFRYNHIKRHRLYRIPPIQIEAATDPHGLA